MTLYEELYYQLTNYPKFYRYEGIKTYRNYNFANGSILDSLEKYIYFSKTNKHHEYYVEKRIKQQIERDLFYQTKYSLNRKCIMNKEKFEEMVVVIENSAFDNKPKSIEFTTSPLIEKLFAKNSIENSLKKENIPYIERVDRNKMGGGMDYAKIG